MVNVFTGLYMAQIGPGSKWSLIMRSFAVKPSGGCPIKQGLPTRHRATNFSALLLAAAATADRWQPPAAAAQVSTIELVWQLEYA
jgi:hypothetical protein